MKEVDLYKPVKSWLNSHLQGCFPNKNVQTFIGADKFISTVLKRHKLQKYFCNSSCFDIKIDVFSIVEYKKGKFKLVIVECKTGKLTLQHLSQLIGYSKIINPVCSILLSSSGLSTSLSNLLDCPTDNLLSYGANNKNRISIAKWNLHTKTLDFTSCIPSGSLDRKNISKL